MAKNFMAIFKLFSISGKRDREGIRHYFCFIVMKRKLQLDEWSMNETERDGRGRSYLNSIQDENYEGMEISDTLAVDTLSFHCGSFSSFSWLPFGVFFPCLNEASFFFFLSNKNIIYPFH